MRAWRSRGRPRSLVRTLVDAVVFAAALLLVFFVLRVAGLIETETGSARAVDGDSLEIGGKSIRLHAIDAPEFKQPCFETDGREWPCGREARDMLRALVRGKETVCRTMDTDRYGRMVAECSVGGQSINEEMVRRGFAIAYIRHARKHERLEAEARAAHRGIWRGTFETPADWREKNKLLTGDAGGGSDLDD